jgi:hypothetical protein
MALGFAMYGHENGTPETNNHSCITVGQFVPPLF